MKHAHLFVVMVLLFLVATAHTAAAFTARICNTGSTEFRVAVRGATGLGGHYIQGWYLTKPGRCFTRGSSWEYDFHFVITYMDASGANGYAPYVPKRQFGRTDIFKTSNRSFCIDFKNPNGSMRKGSMSALAKCKPNETLVPFPIFSTGLRNTQHTLNVSVDPNTLHSASRIIGAKKAASDSKTSPISKCYKGDARACVEAGKASSKGDAITAKKPDLAAKLYTKGCALASPNACFQLTLQINKEGVSERTRTSGFETLRAECPKMTGYDRDQCRYAGVRAIERHAEQTAVPAASYRLAADFFVLGCKLNDMMACTLLGEIMVNGNAGVTDVVAGRDLLTVACRNSGKDVSDLKARQQSCYELGRMLEAGMITPINGLGDANDLYARACTHKNTMACEKIGK